MCNYFTVSQRQCYDGSQRQRQGQGPRVKVKSGPLLVGKVTSQSYVSDSPRAPASTKAQRCPCTARRGAMR
eukprot:m.272331 g.272331  ORF g.272331 m.272331 type:complete len:71 (+) comp19331_c2_seq1:3285-3497(+)